MRIFLDANILFSAANPSGSIRQLLTIVHAAGHECWADEHVIREAHRKTFRFNEAIKRNPEKLSGFPADFMFKLTADEAAALRSQIAMSKGGRSPQAF